MEEKGFTLRQTSIAKGFACLLLLFHHLFYNSPEYYTLFVSVFNFGGVPLECKVAPLGKVCVYMFLFLSGFGVSFVLERNREKKNPWRISLRFVWKLMFGFWVIYLLFVPWQPLIGHQPYTSWKEIVLDLTGFCYFPGYGWLNGNTMNKTWWYISLALLCYVLTPLFDWLTEKTNWLGVLLSAGIIVGISGWLLPKDTIYFVAYLFGMMFQKARIFDYFEKYRQSKNALTFIVPIAFLGVSVLAKLWNDALFWFLPLMLCCILFSFLCLSRIKYLSATLAFIGKHSANIFLFHTFLFRYMRNVFYAPKYSVLIYFIFLAVCLFVSAFIEKIKQWTRVNRLEKFVSEKIEGKSKKCVEY